MNKKKKFDCVEMMHRGALDIYKRTRHMTVEEEAAYWRKRGQELRQEAEGAPRKARRRSAKAGG